MIVSYRLEVRGCGRSRTRPALMIRVAASVLRLIFDFGCTGVSAASILAKYCFTLLSSVVSTG